MESEHSETCCVLGLTLVLRALLDFATVLESYTPARSLSCHSYLFVDESHHLGPEFHSRTSMPSGIYTNCCD